MKAPGREPVIERRRQFATNRGAARVATPVATRGIANPPTTVAIAADGAAFARELGRALASGGEADGPDAARRWARERAARFREQLRAALEDA